MAQFTPGPKVISPGVSLCVSPIRTAATTGVVLRKKSNRFLLNPSGDSEGLLGVPPLLSQSSTSSLLGKGRRVSPKNSHSHSHTDNDGLQMQIFALRERRWMLLFVAYILCQTLLLGIAMERSDRQWRAVNSKLESVQSELVQLKRAAAYNLRANYGIDKERSDEELLSGELY